jgi:hypothetical protein
VVSPLPVTRRSILAVAVAAPLLKAVPAAAAAAAVPPVRADLGVAAYPFDLGQVRLTAGRLMDSGKLLGLRGGAVAQGTQAVQDSDNGTADNLWRLTPSS